MYYTEMNDTQRKLMNALKEHVFGSNYAYKNFKESGEPFPRDYRAVKKLIEWESFAEDILMEIISKCHKLVIINGTGNKKTVDGNGTSGIRCFGSEEKVIISEAETHKKGSHAKKTKQDPTLLSTFRHRLGSRVCIRRNANWSYAEIWNDIVMYTDDYNTKHGTVFYPYVPKRKGGRD